MGAKWIGRGGVITGACEVSPGGKSTCRGDPFASPVDADGSIAVK
jgi:hypothetical protein